METTDYIAKELEDLDRGLNRYLQDLTEDEVQWAPLPGAGSIADHVLHLARFEEEFVQQRLLGLPAAAMEGQSRGRAFSSVLGFYAEVRAATLACVSGLAAEDLERAATIPQGEVRVADVLAIVVAHAAQHLGAASYLRRLQRGPDGVEHV
jgi:uncharacterized damage-inducible protein DinB